ncbi:MULTISPECIES: hypothetical protein [unclassified Bradyrhizobium]
MLMLQATRQYSIAVAPRSSLKKLEINWRIKIPADASRGFLPTCVLAAT